jgi:aminomethyltransferase
MPLPTPFHPRTAALCESLAWKEWAGYHAVRSYDVYFEREYYAFRHSAGLLDVTPLYKYDVRGRDAARFLSWLTVRDVGKLAPGRVTYLCWCDADGKVLDDGTITCWGPGEYRLTSADPSWAWLLQQAQGLAVEITDRSSDLAALALQGPRSRAILAAVAGKEIEALRFFRATHAKIAGVAVDVTRTGYTGDLGYEVWMSADDALPVWDALVAAGAPHGLLPAGLDALDVTRVEAGFILGGVDYTSARRALIESQKSTPSEIGLGWCVELEREPFLGQAALRREAGYGPRLAFVGLVLSWDDLHELYDSFGLPPALPSHAWRQSIPLYHGAVQVGYATSGAWSPTLKQKLALATVEAAFATEGTTLSMEWTVEHQRKTVHATVARRPFFDPPRKRA